jgi:hypothetical protein
MPLHFASVRKRVVMRIWIAEQDYVHEGMDMFAAAVSKELAMKACVDREREREGITGWRARHVADPIFIWTEGEVPTVFKGVCGHNDYIVYETDLIGTEE